MNRDGPTRGDLMGAPLVASARQRQNQPLLAELPTPILPSPSLKTAIARACANQQVTWKEKLNYFFAPTVTSSG